MRPIKMDPLSRAKLKHFHNNPYVATQQHIPAANKEEDELEEFTLKQYR